MKVLVRAGLGTLATLFLVACASSMPPPQPDTPRNLIFLPAR